MKKILFISLIFLLFSCQDSNENKIGVIEEKGDIVDGYVETLDTSIQDAKAARKLIDNRYTELGNEADKY